MKKITPTPWILSDAFSGVIRANHELPMTGQFAIGRMDDGEDAAFVIRVVNSVTSKTGVLAQLKAAVDLLGAMPVSEKDRSIIEAHVRQYKAAIAEVEA